MQIGPRYKKARYLGAPVFLKTQTQKYAIRAQAKQKTAKRKRGKSEYGQQLLEKQKARYSYGVSSGQFANYVTKALQATGDNAKNLLNLLEGRLDNVVVRAGFAKSRSAARQMVAHGHIVVDGKKVTIPSYEVSIGEKVGIREGSKKKPLFANLDEELKASKSPAWLSVDAGTHVITVAGEPTVETSDLLFDVRAVLQFYTR